LTVRAVIATSKPCLARVTAMPLPTPRLAPVTKARFLDLDICILSHLRPGLQQAELSFSKRVSPDCGTVKGMGKRSNGA